jgi:ATP synthase protein I
MSERDDKPPKTDLSDDLEDFDRRLSDKIAERRAKYPEDDGTRSAWSVGLRYGSGFAGGVLVGTGLGWFADKSFGSAPWGLLVGLMLGFAAGLRNIMREAAELSADQSAGETPADDGTEDE